MLDKQVLTEVPLPTHIADELRRYDAYLHDVRGLAPATRSNQLRIVGLFLRQSFERRAVDLRKLRPDASESEWSRNDESQCRIEANLNPVHWKLASLPRALAPEEVGHLLDTVAGARRWPRRSYAIVRLALDMGLRFGEIAQLMISDIDWRAGTATLRGTKSLRQDVLPLPMETGQALADLPDGFWPKITFHIDW